MGRTATIPRKLELPLIRRPAHSGSENARIPAWCDRILYKGDPLKQINYTTAPLYFSDHRPVYATFQCIISHVDESLKERLVHELYENRKLQLKKIAARARGAVIDSNIAEYEFIGSEQPGTSSDHNRWWLDDGKGSTVVSIPVED